MIRNLMISFWVCFMIALPRIGYSQKVFKVDYESQAGWRNLEKQHLLLF